MKPGTRGPDRVQLVAAASRFQRARGPRGKQKSTRGPRAQPRPPETATDATTGAPLESIDATLPSTPVDSLDPVAGSGQAGPIAPAGAAPEITATDAKPRRPAVDETVAAILRDAERRATAGTADDTLSALSQERMIGRADLQDVRFLEVGVAVARGVAKIRVPGKSGSASLVGPRILLTNNHVIPDPAVAVDGVAQFDLQDDSLGNALPRQDFALDPGYFFFTDKTLDVTLIGMAELSEAGQPAASYPWTRIAAADRDLEHRDAITIIQHPLGGMKQIAFRNNDVILVEQLPNFVHYTTDTQKGSSGSPCFDDQWRLVAVHHLSVAAVNDQKQVLTRDGKVYREGIDSQDAIQWIANEGTRMSAVEKALRGASLAAEHVPRRAAMLGADPPNPVVLAREASAPARRGGRGYRSAYGRGSMSRSGSGVSVIVNIAGDEIRGVQIERLGDADGHGATAGPRPGAAPGTLGAAGTGQTPLDDGAGAREKIEIDPDWKNRPGYDRDFLGVRIPLPKIPEEKEEITLKIPAEFRAAGADPLVFPYHHFSIAFNKKRRIAWYSAANVDGDRRAHKYVREDDEWFFDPRMDDEDAPRNQIGEELYAARKTDRGHLTRYLDIQWGDTLEETRNATNDSFHFSNCALQLEGFNRGKDRWQGIERFLLEKKARKEKRRIVVFTGPILRKDDPLYRSKVMEDNGTPAVRVPLSFWKICALVPEDGRKLAVTAFVLGQTDIVELPGFEEAFDVTAVQITVEKLAKLVGLGFAKILVEHDHFAKEGPGALEAAATLETLEDIVV